MMIDFVQIAHASTEAVSQVAVEASSSASPLATLGVDWKLFLAQLFNFAIVVFVLWRWILKPIVATLSDRSRNLSASLAEAEQVQKDKKNFQSWKEEEILSTKKQASLILTKARDEAKLAKQEILASATAEQEELVENTRKQLDYEKEKIIDSAKADIAEIIVSASEKILRQKIDKESDKQIIKDSLKTIS